MEQIPDFAWVWFDVDAAAWVIECWACNAERRVVEHWESLPDSKIKAVLVRVAERHNQERHAGVP